MAPAVHTDGRLQGDRRRPPPPPLPPFPGKPTCFLRLRPPVNRVGLQSDPSNNAQRGFVVDDLRFGGPLQVAVTKARPTGGRSLHRRRLRRSSGTWATFCVMLRQTSAWLFAYPAEVLIASRRRAKQKQTQAGSREPVRGTRATFGPIQQAHRAGPSSINRNHRQHNFELCRQSSSR